MQQRLIAMIVEKPIRGLLLGLPFAIAFAWLAIHSYGEMSAFESGPTTCSLEDALVAARSRDAYVRIPQASIDCANRVLDRTQSPPYTYAPLLGAAGGYVGFATFDRDACDAPAEGIVGVLHATNERKLTRLRGQLPDEALAYDLCTYCGITNSRLGVYLGAGLALAALSLYPLALYANRKQRARG